MTIEDYALEITIKVTSPENEEIAEFKSECLSDETLADIFTDVEKHMDTLKQEALEELEKDLLSNNRFCINGNCEE
jgi:predicted secreted Zn-dependent protease